MTPAPKRTFSHESDLCTDNGDYRHGVQRDLFVTVIGPLCESDIAGHSRPKATNALSRTNRSKAPSAATRLPGQMHAAGRTETPRYGYTSKAFSCRSVDARHPYGHRRSDLNKVSKRSRYINVMLGLLLMQTGTRAADIAHMHTCILVHMHTCSHSHIHTLLSMHMHTCIHTYMHT